MLWERRGSVESFGGLRDVGVSARGGIAVIEHADDGFMTGRRHGADFVFKASRDFGFASEPARDDLDGDDLTIVQAFRAIDLAHAAAADEFVDFVAVDFE